MTAPHDQEQRGLALCELCLGNGWHAGVAVAPDGRVWPWLIGPASKDGQGGEVAFPAHEQVGPLPQPYKDRLAGLHLCGAPTQSGTPCRNYAGHCRHHRQTTTTPTTEEN